MQPWMPRIIPGGVPVSSGIQAAPAQVTPNGEEGHFQWKDGCRFDKSGQYPGGRYIAKKIIGSGTYGKVVECVDQKYGAQTAIKLVRRGIPAFREAAMKEIQILNELDGRCGTVKMLRSFEHEGHLCMSFDLLGEGVKSVLKRSGPFTINDQQSIAIQLIAALDYVHDKGICHTDLTTDNILIVSRPSDGPLGIKLIDFGSSVRSFDQHNPQIGTPEYRSPEVLLQATWSYPTDMWSLGCILAELHTGKTLFPLAREDLHLELMQRLLSKLMPPTLLARGLSNLNSHNRALLTTDSSGAPRLKPYSKPERVASFHRLENVIAHPALVDLLRTTLELDPARRAVAKAAARHPFLTSPPAPAPTPAPAPIKPVDPDPPVVVSQVRSPAPAAQPRSAAANRPRVPALHARALERAAYEDVSDDDGGEILSLLDEDTRPAKPAFPPPARNGDAAGAGPSPAPFSPDSNWTRAARPAPRIADTARSGLAPGPTYSGPAAAPATATGAGLGETTARPVPAWGLHDNGGHYGVASPPSALASAAQGAGATVCGGEPMPPPVGEQDYDAGGGSSGDLQQRVWALEGGLRQKQRLVDFLLDKHAAELGEVRMVAAGALRELGERLELLERRAETMIPRDTHEALVARLMADADDLRGQLANFEARQQQLLLLQHQQQREQQREQELRLREQQQQQGGAEAAALRQQVRMEQAQVTRLLAELSEAQRHLRQAVPLAQHENEMEALRRRALDAEARAQAAASAADGQVRLQRALATHVQETESLRERLRAEQGEGARRAAEASELQRRLRTMVPREQYEGEVESLRNRVRADFVAFSAVLAEAEGGGDSSSGRGETSAAGCDLPSLQARIRALGVRVRAGGGGGGGGSPSPSGAAAAQDNEVGRLQRRFLAMAERMHGLEQEAAALRAALHAARVELARANVDRDELRGRVGVANGAAPPAPPLRVGGDVAARAEENGRAPQRAAQPAPRLGALGAQ